MSKKNILHKSSIVFFCFSVISGSVFGDFAGGSGTADDPYLVENSEHLNAVRDYPESHFEQTGSIEFSSLDFQTGGLYYNDGDGWEPIADFTGTYDGGGYTISNLRIFRDGDSDVGLFVHLSDAEISNLHIRDSEVHGDETVGGLAAGADNSLIKQSSFSGSVTGLDDVGGLIGYNYSSTVTECFSIGSVTGNGISVGGLIGYNTGHVEYSRSSADIASDGERIGGLIGYNSAEIFRSYSTGTVSGDGRRVGGLVGNNNSAIRESYSTGAVSGYETVGGLAGRSTGNIFSSYSRSSATGDSNIGGFIGRTSSSLIENSYSTGAVASSSDNGGFIGGASITTTVENSFWDTETSGQDSSAEGTGKTTAELTDSETFTDAAWDFDSTWKIDENMNDGYPFLAWQQLSPGVTSWAEPQPVYYGSALDDVELSGGEAEVEGTFIFADSLHDRLPLGESEYTLVFIPDDEDRYYTVDTTVTIIVNPAPVEVFATPVSKIYGADDPPLTYTAEGLLDDDELTGELSRVFGEDVGVYVINQGTLSADEKYTISFSGGVLEIEPRPVMVTAEDQSRIYGEDDPPLTYTAEGLLDDDELTGEPAREEGKKVGEYAVVQGSLSAGDNYHITFNDGIFTIEPRELIITAEDISIEEHEDDPGVYPVSYDGFAYDDDEAIVSGLIVLRQPGDTVGNYAIIPSSAEAPNYDVTHVNGVFSITETTDLIHEEEVRSNGASHPVFFGKNPVSAQDERADIFVVTGDPAQVSITIYDMVGNVIDRQDASAQTREAGRFSWDLRNQQGVRVSAGSYAVIATVEYDNGGELRYRAVLGVQE
ncbi:MAG: MBG domain-containing protein [Fibrobacterota bacterium]